MARSHKILGLKVSAEELERFRRLQRARGDTTASATLRALILTAPIPRQGSAPNLGRKRARTSAAVKPRQQPDPSSDVPDLSSAST